MLGFNEDMSLKLILFIIGLHIGALWVAVFFALFGGCNAGV